MFQNGTSSPRSPVADCLLACLCGPETRAATARPTPLSRINNDGIMPVREGISQRSFASSIGLRRPMAPPYTSAPRSLRLWPNLQSRRTNTVTFLGCGVASAIATSFNTPITAVILPMTIIGHYSLRAFAPITIAAVAGNAVAIHHGRFFDGFQNLTAPAELTLGQYPLRLCRTHRRPLRYNLHAESGEHEKGGGQNQTSLVNRPAIAGFAIAIVAIWLPNLLGLVEETPHR